MATLLFNLTNVPEDEADDVRRLLVEQGVPFYETDSGRWKSGVAALWLEEPEQLEWARQVIANYQAERQIRAQEEYAQLKARGELPSWGTRFRSDPWRFSAQLLVTGVATAALLALMILPFLAFVSR